MLPEKFIKRLESQQYINSGALIKALAEPSPVSIRINRGKWDKVPINSETVLWSDSGYYLDSRPSFTLDPLFHSGCYYPQEASSMFPGYVFSQVMPSNKNLRVLDLCGAPGGKSTQLSDLLGSGSLLISNEVIKARASVLAETLTKWGAGNFIVTQSDPSVFGRIKGYFDLILIDAPCSGEGMFRNSIAINEWSEENTRHCSERQKRIVMDVWPALKENGLLLFSTCTFNPGENEENIKWLIEKQNAESVKLDLNGLSGVTEIDYNGIHGYGFYPDKIKGEGFFISVIRKKGKEEYSPVKSRKNPDLKPEKNDVAFAERWTLFQKENLLRHRDEVNAIPCPMEEYIHLYKNLNIVKGGTLLFTVKKSDYLPSHDLALSQFMKTGAFPSRKVDLSEAISYMRRESFAIDNLMEGWNLLNYQGVNAGFVKNIGKRYNNYFPVEWRIRMDKPEQGSENIIRWNIANANSK